MPEAAPAARRSGSRAASVAPDSRTPLFGRDAELSGLVERIGSGAPLVTITGPGGVGKTRVALEVAGRLGYRPLFLQLADLRASDIADAIARALAAVRTGFSDAASAARRGAGAIDAADRQGPVLLLLDTLDRLHGAEQLSRLAGVIGQAQRHDPDLLLLVTSRSRLALSFEHVVPLSGLGVQPDGPAAQMFRERAKAVGGYVDDPVHDEAIAAICQLLRGLPLAIELAASRTTLLPPAALLARLQLRDPSSLLDLLANGPVDIPARHRSIRATMSWSYQLLAVTEQTLFRRLGVFAGSFSLEAAEWVCAGPAQDGGGPRGAQILDGIDRLVNLHLVEPTGRDPEYPRFTLLEAPRAYAIELLEMSGELELVNARMHHWCLHFAERAGRGLASAQERRWLDLVESELQTIRTTLAALAKAADAIRGIVLVAAVVDRWIRLGPIREALTWLRTFLDCDRLDGQLSDSERAGAICLMQRLLLESGGRPDITELRQARAIVVGSHCSVGEWHRATDHLIHALLLLGEFTEGLTLIDAAAARARESDDSFWLSLHLFERARAQWLAEQSGRTGQVLAHVEESLAVARATSHHRVAAWSQALLGLCLVAQRDWSAAHTAMAAAVDDLRRLEDRPAQIAALQCLGTILIERQQSAAAAECLREAMIEAQRVGYGYGEIQCTWAIAFLAASTGRITDATSMDDALADRLDTVERGLPAVLVIDYATAMTRARVGSGAASRASRGHGWGWLRTRALEVVTEIASTDIPTDQSPGDSAVTRNPAAAPPPAGTVARGATSTTAAAPQRSVITARELEVLASIASGQTNAQIAAELFLSTKTVMHHSTSIYRKLGVRGRAEAVALAYRSGLLQARGG